jgi:hypothetical protein
MRMINNIWLESRFRASGARSAGMNGYREERENQPNVRSVRALDLTNLEKRKRLIDYEPLQATNRTTHDQVIKTELKILVIV